MNDKVKQALANINAVVAGTKMTRAEHSELVNNIMLIEQELIYAQECHVADMGNKEAK